MDLTTENGKKYCLVSNGSNYSVNVIAGECQVGLKTYQFTLQGDSAGSDGVYGLEYIESAAPASNNNYRSVQVRQVSDLEILITVNSLANSL